MSNWTRFYDMSSGGGQKEAFKLCFIEADSETAAVIFYNRFGHSPDRVTCTCCGPDYSYDDERGDLAEASAYDRGCRNVKQGDDWVYLEEGDPERSWSPYVPLDEFVKRDDVMVIRAEDITDEDRRGSVPAQGYVWVD